MSRKLRVYLDTSVLGGCFDPEFTAWSSRLIEGCRLGYFHAVLSEATAAEVVQAPEAVRELHAELLAEGADLIPVNPEVVELSAAYLERGILDPRFRNDTLHIALATIAEVDVLASWNFRHVVRIDKIRAFNAVNPERGHKLLAIYSPREVLGDEDAGT